jgi:hypothetical protein
MAEIATDGRGSVFSPSQDYAKMESMFIGKPPGFAQVLRILREAEDAINAA